jgi:hypothetical protein
MRLSITRATLVVAMIAGLTAPCIAQEGVPQGWLGTWRLNVEKSTYNPGPAPYKRGTLLVEPWNGRVRVVSDLVGVRGVVTHTEWTGLFDGNDYPVQGIDEALSYSYRPIDERTCEIIVKADDRVVARSRSTLSPDGRTLTTTTSGRNARGGEITTTTVYEKADN